nr:MAG TPA: hypothetical protein [Caudoviricetes sp.]
MLYTSKQMAQNQRRSISLYPARALKCAIKQLYIIEESCEVKPLALA